jgi:AcrR family transcriptional regulator
VALAPDEHDDRGSRMRRERRQQIVDAAKAVFAERGYHNASVSDIIGRARIARGTFYLYFESKQQIFETILAEALEVLRSRITRIDVEPGAPPPLEQLRGNLVRVMDYVLGDPHFSRLLLSHSLSSDPEAAERVQQFYDHVHGMIERSLGHGVDMGLVRPCNPALVASALLGAARGIIDRVLRTDPPPAAGAIVDELIAFALRGVVVANRW